MIDLSKCFRVGRAMSDMKQAHVATVLGVTRPYLSALENGKVDSCGLALLEDVAEVYGMKLSEFIALGE